MDLEQTRAVVDAAFDAGVTLFDTADVYGQGGSERYLGEILAARRQQVVIATKWGSGMDARHDIAWGSRRYIRQAAEASLQRLRTDYIDLYQMHWPDPRTPIEETIDALDELVREGKVRYTGSSHFSGWQVADADWIARHHGRARFVAAQNHYSLLQRARRSGTDPRLPALRRRPAAVLPAGERPADRQVPARSRRRRRLAHGRSPDRCAHLRRAGGAGGIRDAARPLAARTGDRISRRNRPVVGSVITGATRPEQIRANAAATDWQPTAADLAELDTLLKRAAADSPQA